MFLGERAHGGGDGGGGGDNDDFGEYKIFVLLFYYNELI